MTDPAQPAQPTPAAPLTEAEDKQWASFAHLGGILGFLPALIIWLIFKDRGPKTNVEAKEALNFQITVTIGYIACIILGTVLAIVFIGFLFYLIQFAIWVAAIILSIIGFTKVNAGGSYRYPFAIRLIK
ncbi:DUF4870 domain-containing protein [Protaetiibacter sp. SSC-01]|uniref:DUF4870 domain-containing protein n=1 Tax=Protaetiibacter sp. SSC-01 TaxID=2759943 RepID=UPI00165748A1|nr:DUF4870 domain-containing protein [Protaetiibacter sp. SSC-01]QNO36659.1 DUF4870 domain-containing protein [Protaetiibacter sp. SSC-01]